MKQLGKRTTTHSDICLHLLVTCPLNPFILLAVIAADWATPLAHASSISILWTEHVTNTLLSLLLSLALFDAQGCHCQGCMRKLSHGRIHGLARHRGAFQQFLKMLLVALQIQALHLPTNSATQIGSFLSFCVVPSVDCRLELIDLLQIIFQILQRLLLANNQESSTCKTSSNPVLGFQTPRTPSVSWYPISCGVPHTCLAQSWSASRVQYKDRTRSAVGRRSSETRSSSGPFSVVSR